MVSRIPVLRVAAFLMFVTPRGSSPPVAAPQTTGIAECDAYHAMVSACLPRMCEAERAVSELELSLNREVLAKAVELKGRDAAAKGCAQDILEQISDDPYGCYESQRAKAGMPVAAIRDVRIRPAATSVTISFDVSPETRSQGPLEVALLSEDLEPQVRYVLSRSDGMFTLNTAVQQPVTATAGPEAKPVADSQTFRLEPGVPYCFAIKSRAGDQRRGSFTTLH